MQKSEFSRWILIMLSPQQLQEFDQQGYLVIPDFISPIQRQGLMQRAEELIEAFEPPPVRSIFKTDEQERTSDDYFLASGSNVTFSLKRRP